MTVEIQRAAIPTDRIDFLKRRIKQLAIAYIILSVILLVLGFTVCIMIILFVYIPVVGIITIALDVYICLYFKKIVEIKEEVEFKRLEPQKFTLSSLIALLVCCWIYVFYIYLVYMIKSEAVDTFILSANYVYLAGLVILVAIVLIIGFELKVYQKETRISAILLVTYIILYIPDLTKFYYRFLVSVIPFTLLLRALLGVAVTLIAFILYKISKMRILFLLVIYGWSYSLLEIINILSYVGYFPTNTFLIANNTIILFAMLCFIISMTVFATRIMHIKSKPLVLDTNHKT